jgi:hypothetical protein
MPGAGTKQQSSEPANSIATAAGDRQMTPDAVLNEFGQICVALPAAGAVIAVRDMAGMRCTVSFGNAPAVGSRLSTDTAFTAQCMETGEVVVCEEVGSDPRITPSVGARSNFGSAVTVPIHAQGSVVGLIQVFCSQPSAMDPLAIAALQAVARLFAALMIFDAANGGQPIVGGSLVHPVVLPRLIAAQEPPSITGLAPDAPDAPEQAGKQEIYRTFDAGTNTEVTKAARPRMQSATISQLPSDKPTPTRVWLITAAFLVVLSLLFLFLFKGAYRSQNESIENPATRSID